MANTVVGFFDSASEAQNAVEQLVQSGFSRANIDVSSGSSAGTSGGSYSGSNAGSSDNSYSGSNTGSSDSSYSGSNVGSSDSSYSGSSTTSGDTHRDSDHDSGNAVTRFFKNLFGDNDDEANRYSTVAQRSGAIVTVHADSDDEAERAADLLDDNGAVNVDERASDYGYSSTPMSDTTSASMSDTSSTTFTDNTYGAVTGATSGNTSDTTSYDNINADRSADTSNTNREGVIPVIQEELQVGKKTVETGGVRVRSRIVQRPVEESIRLREERVTVERTPVNRVVTGDMATFQEQDIELTETSEVPVVHKEARVVEEVRVTKDASEREETIHDTLRNTEVDVENLENRNTNRSGDYDTNTGNTNSSNNSGI